MKKVLIMVMVFVMTLSISVFAYTAPSVVSAGGIGNIDGIILGIFQTVGYIVAIAVLMFVGIKFMLASPAEKANIKGMMVPYIIGAVLIFAASSIIGIIEGWGSAIS